MDAHDMTTIGDEVELAKKALDIEEGTSIPSFLIDSQERFARMSLMDLAAHFADVVVAVALRRPGSTPRKILHERAVAYPITDDAWHDRVRNELVRALRARGVEFDVLKEDGVDVEGEGRSSEEGA